MFRVAPLVIRLAGFCVSQLKSSTFGNVIRAFRSSVLFPAALATLLSACATEGDFGRPRPTVFTKVTDEVLLNTNIVTRGWTYGEFTRDEVVMREAAQRLAGPLHLQAGPPADTYKPSRISYDRPKDGYITDYWPHPAENAVGDIIRELDLDHQALTHFGEAARRVLRNDSQRLIVLLKHDPTRHKKRREEARQRMQENYHFIESVFDSLGRRLQSYHYAIDGLRTHAPDPALVEVQGQLDHLRDRTSALEYELSHFFGAALARSEQQSPQYDHHVTQQGWGHRSFGRRPYGEPSYSEHTIPPPRTYYK